MSTQTIRRPARQAGITRFRLGVEEWLALRAAVLAQADGTTPTGFAPEDLGRDHCLSRAERHRAWESLCSRDLAVHVPDDDDLTAVAPEYVPGLRTLMQPEVCLDAGSWSGDVVLDRAVAWTGGRSASLMRRRHLVPTGGLEQEDAVELSLSPEAVLLGDIMRALPTHDGPATAVLPDPVRVDWPESAGISQALRADRPDVAAHLSSLPPCALDGVAPAGKELVGGASVSGSRRGDADGAHSFHGVWLWTCSDDIIELSDATAHGVLLRPTDVARVRTGVVSALTALLQAPEAL